MTSRVTSVAGVYKGGVIVPVEALALPEGARVEILLPVTPEPPTSVAASPEERGEEGGLTDQWEREE
ncbi:MAG: hypothetical protein IT429_23070 [Gemmataceae bacterium]|nr:hypothetical protein [Gemmataceae bacterium]